MAFENLSERLQNAIKMFRGSGKITEDDLKAPLREVRMALLEADVNFKVVKDFVANIKERALGETVQQSLTPGQQIIKIVNDELTQLLGGTQSKLTVADKPPTVIMLVGLQGAGKTTTAGKRQSAAQKAKATAGSGRRLPPGGYQTITGTGAAALPACLCPRRSGISGRDSASVNG
nr:signal recognition particle receptor subunit alpha [Phascolarctobacterium sp.]